MWRGGCGKPLNERLFGGDRRLIILNLLIVWRHADSL
jgi:hypothetical protein